MSKNLIVILYFSLAAMALVATGVVAILAPEQFDKIFQGALQVLALASTAAVTIYLLGKNANTLEEVKTQTNGNLSRLQEQLVAERAEKDALHQQLIQVVGESPAKKPSN